MADKHRRLMSSSYINYQAIDKENKWWPTELVTNPSEYAGIIVRNWLTPASLIALKVIFPVTRVSHDDKGHQPKDLSGLILVEQVRSLLFICHMTTYITRNCTAENLNKYKQFLEEIRKEFSLSESAILDCTDPRRLVPTVRIVSAPGFFSELVTLLDLYLR
jgi:hypothetical protein